jgi:hypothetical protein
MVLSTLSQYILPLTVIFVISILRVWYFQKEWFILIILLWLTIPKSYHIEQKLPIYIFFIIIFVLFLDKFMLFKITSRQKILNCQTTNNNSMVNRASIIVSRKKNIHRGITMETHMQISNIILITKVLITYTSTLRGA